MALKLKAPFIPLQFVLQKTVPAVSISLRWKNCSGWIPQPVSISIFYFPELCAVRAYTKQAVASGQHDQFPYSQHLLSKEDTNEEYMQSPVSLSLCRKEELLGEAQQPKYKFSFLSSWAGRAILGRFDSQRKLACPTPQLWAADLYCVVVAAIPQHQFLLPSLGQHTLWHKRGGYRRGTWWRLSSQTRQLLLYSASVLYHAHPSFLFIRWKGGKSLKN